MNSALAAREARAWDLARLAAEELRRQFAVSRLLHPWSDVDIAAWGLRSEDTFRAIGVVMDIDTEIPVNLVDVGACPPSLLRVIEQEGVHL